MLDLKFVRENLDKIKRNIEIKNEKCSIDSISQLDAKRRAVIQEVEDLKNTRNVVSKEIAAMKKSKLDASEQIAAMKQVSENIKSLDDELRNIDLELKQILLTIPNMAHESVPVGKTEEDNELIRSWGEVKPDIEVDHIEIAKKTGALDFERAGKVSGGGFAFYLGAGAALERALINFMIDFHVERNGYREIMPPFMVNAAAMTGTGQLPKMIDDMYHIEKDGMFMIPTAEVPITNFHAGEILPAEALPVKFCGYSPCFRREAGSYGKEVHGFLRVHQFNKVELVKLCAPENSYDELESLVSDVESILQALELPYRVVTLCSGDTSFSSAKTYDLEVWSPGEKKWLEVSSCSNFEDFQARRANIRFRRDAKSKPEFVHTLNGSGLATSRIMVATLENNWTSDGKVKIPEALKKYFKHDYL